MNNVAMSVNSSGPLEKVTGVGLENSLRLTMSPMYGGRSVKYRIYISEIGTTRSKVILKRKIEACWFLRSFRN